MSLKLHFSKFKLPFAFQCLLLNLKLLHNASEGLFEPINLVIKLFAHLKFELGVKLLGGGRLLF